MEHPSEEARRTYLKQHPKANPKNHTVNEGKGPAAAPPKGKKGPPPPPSERNKPKVKPEKDEDAKEKTRRLFKSLSGKAKTMLAHASKEVRRFVKDPGHRQRVLKDAAAAVQKTPKGYVDKVIHVAKEEVHEFKEASHALKDVMQGKKLTPQQKKSVRTVAIHMGIGIAAAALTTTGVFAGMAALSKGMAQKVALKAALRSLENVHVMNEVSHIGHGLMHLAKDRKKLPPEEAFGALVLKYVIKELEQLDEETLAEILNETAGAREKSARNLYSASADDLIPTLERADTLVEDLEDWAKRFDGVLLVARSESKLPDNRVWQDRFVKYFEESDYLLTGLRHVDDVLDGIYLGDSSELADIANEARHLLGITHMARIEYAISDIDFTAHPKTGREEITYDIDTLKKWSRAFHQWATKAKTGLRNLKRRALRSV